MPGLVQQTSQLGQALAVHPHADPLVHGRGADGLVELDARLVPLEDGPLEAATVHGDDLLGQLDQQLLAVALFALRGPDKEVLEVDAALGAPGAVVVKVQGHAGGRAGLVEQQQAARRPGRRRRLRVGRGGARLDALPGKGDGRQERRLGRLDGRELVLVVGELLD